MATVSGLCSQMPDGGSAKERQQLGSVAQEEFHPPQSFERLLPRRRGWLEGGGFED